MFKLILGTLGALYLALLIFGDESRRPEEVARVGAFDGLNFDFSEWIGPASAERTSLVVPDISETEAVALALEAGRQHRADQEAEPLVGKLVAAVETPAEGTVGDDPLDASMWYVTGTTVNVRSGPGTSNPVVTRVSFGDAAEVLGAPSDGWVQIRPAGSETTGWISARFLNPDAPG